MYNTASQIKFKISMLRSSLFDYSDTYIFVSGTITVVEVALGRGNNDIEVVFKNCGPFTDCTSEINNTQIDNAKYIDILMPMYNLIEYSNNYSKTSGSLWKYYRDETALTDASTLDHFPGNNASFEVKQKITSKIGNNGTKDVKIMVQLKYLGNFWRTLAMPSINCNINLILTWSKNCIISNPAVNQHTTLAITDTKISVQGVSV